MVVGGEWRYEVGRTGFKNIFLCRGDKGRGMAAERERQSCRGKPTWMCANGTSALSRLVAIPYPKRLKYYAGWLMLTAWPLSGDCVGNCVRLPSGLLQIPLLWPRRLWISWGSFWQAFRQRGIKRSACFAEQRLQLPAAPLHHSEPKFGDAGSEIIATQM